MSEERVEDYELHGEIQMGWVQGGRDGEYIYCPQAHGDPVYEACKRWADRVFDNSVNAAILNLRLCLGGFGLGAAGGIRACIYKYSAAVPLLIACLGLTILGGYAGAILCYDWFENALDGCRDEYWDNIEFCCDLYCASHPEDC